MSVFKKEEPWIGVDLDGTLALYGEWHGIEHIGDPVPKVVWLVRKLMDKGYNVKVFTARVSNGPEAIPPIQTWVKKHIGVDLDVTNVKTPGCILMIDDRATHCTFNSGHTHIREIEKILCRGWKQI